MSGSEVRLGRLFNQTSGQSFVVAFDRTLAEGPVPYGIHPEETVRAIIEAAPDGVLLGPGLAKQLGHLFAFRGSPALALRIDFPFFADAARGDGEHHRIICTPAEALALGADAATMFLIHGFRDGAVYADNVRRVAETSQACDRLGLPLIVEAVLWGSEVQDPRDPIALAAVCRIAAELGADAIKTQYTGDIETMREVIHACPIPVFVLGGPKMDDPSEISTYTAGAVKAGARGVIFGRNVWQRDDIKETVAQISRAVHG